MGKLKYKKLKMAKYLKSQINKKSNSVAIFFKGWVYPQIHKHMKYSAFDIGRFSNDVIFRERVSLVILYKCGL